ncbi:MAG: hypothetical protein M3Y80_11215 [Verrucomicrobiota bacterium]|nr:hypothetical protein [Verrucomicrobiota bacterium]
MRFGKMVPEQAAAQSWRYQVIGGKEEGLLLYLRRPRFIGLEDAAARLGATLFDEPANVTHAACAGRDIVIRDPESLAGVETGVATLLSPE